MPVREIMYNSSVSSMQDHGYCIDPTVARNRSRATVYLSSMTLRGGGCVPDASLSLHPDAAPAFRPAPPPSVMPAWTATTTTRPCASGVHASQSTLSSQLELCRHSHKMRFPVPPQQ
jgi:hypothetical protein